MSDKGIVPTGFSDRSIRRRVQSTVAESMVQLQNMSCVHDQSEGMSAAASEITGDLILVGESNMPDQAATDREYCSPVCDTLTDSDGCDDVANSSNTSSVESDSAENESMTCDSVGDDNSDPNISHTSPVSLILALIDWVLLYDIPRSAVRSLLAILKPFHPELPLDPRTLMKTPTHYALKNISGGQYYHFGISGGIQLEKGPDGPGPLMLQFNVDGLPLFKSSSTELWPILCYVKQSQLEPFVVGLYCGKRKPVDIFEYLEDFVNDLSQLLSDGITKNDVHRDVVIDCFVCDAPARAYLKNVKTFSGYYGCEKCKQEGEYVEGKVTFPLTSAPLRTDMDFHRQTNEEHHNGPTPLSSLNFGLVTGFVID